MGEYHSKFISASLIGLKLEECKKKTAIENKKQIKMQWEVCKGNKLHKQA